MKSLLKRLNDLFSLPYMAPVLLLVMTILTYGLFFWQLGFYWDDLPISWIRYQFGLGAMVRYFSTNRPVWGLLYQITTRIFPDVPVYWQIFALFWRWVTAVLVWALIRQLWPGKRSLAFVISLLFLLYPGFNQQSGAFLYSHFFIVLSFLLFSWLLMLWAFRNPKRFWLLTIFSVCFSALNLWMMEYFFVLELFRPFIIFYSILTNDTDHHPSHVIRRIVSLWLPYLLVFLADVYWRLFVFNDQVYQPVLIPSLKAAPWATIVELIKTVFSSVWVASVQAWMQVFHFPNPVVDGLRTTLSYAVVVLAVFVLCGFYLLSVLNKEESKNRNWWLILLGLIAMFLAGGPFWLINLPVTLGYPENRFTLPFMLGVSLLFAGLLQFIPGRIRVFLCAAFVALAAGRQLWWADSFRRDWTTQKNMFWQMTWRAPGLKPNTLVLINEGALNYYADNSLAAALNWIYDPKPHSPEQIHYALFFPTNRIGNNLPELQAGLPIQYNYLVGMFNGNTSQVVAFYYQPPGCLRLLDPQIDPQNHFIPDESLMRTAAPLSSPAWITPTQTAEMPQVYGPEPEHGWCYYFEQADLARQLGDWPRVVKLGDIAFHLNDYPNDPIERFVFIEGYAHAGDWNQVRDLSLTSFKVSPSYVGPLLCKLLARIDHDIPSSSDKESSLNELRTKFHCLP
jgi:hypothetical protein